MPAQLHSHLLLHAADSYHPSHEVDINAFNICIQPGTHPAPRLTQTHHPAPAGPAASMLHPSAQLLLPMMPAGKISDGQPPGRAPPMQPAVKTHNCRTPTPTPPRSTPPYMAINKSCAPHQAWL
mmetsp:Transcript_33541/g.84976  ORF Transcript_33541/g.84976 Transcript_33541/m.84976 type:complete len:124 (-) Transcript_33541:91-462(-)